MKKIIILILLSMLLACVTACSGSKNPETPAPDNTNRPTDKSVCELLDSLAEKNYSTVRVDVITTTDFAELCSSYVLTQSVVTYNIERLNLLPLDGNITDWSLDYKTTTSGYAQINNGQVVELNGNKDFTLPSYSELKGNFNFDESNFKNIVAGNNSFEAEVISPTQFYGADVDISNLKVKVDYTDIALARMTISYSTDNATIQTVYAFE